MQNDNPQTLLTTNWAAQAPSKNKLQVLVFDEVCHDFVQTPGTTQHD